MEGLVSNYPVLLHHHHHHHWPPRISTPASVHDDCCAGTTSIHQPWPSNERLRKDAVKKGNWVRSTNVWWLVGAHQPSSVGKIFSIILRHPIFHRVQPQCFGCMRATSSFEKFLYGSEVWLHVNTDGRSTFFEEGMKNYRPIIDLRMCFDINSKILWRWIWK